jgi:hypothetical protein
VGFNFWVIFRLTFFAALQQTCMIDSPARAEFKEGPHVEKAMGTHHFTQRAHRAGLKRSPFFYLK